MIQTMNQTDDALITPQSYALPSDNAAFVTNSFTFDVRVVNTPEVVVVSFSMFLAGFILLQSAYLNGKKMHFIRFSADCCAVCAIVYGIFFFISIYRPNPTKSAVVWDFLMNGMCSVIIQLFDNYIFVQQVEAIKKMSNWKKIGIQIYIWVMLVILWLPAYFIVPFFYDVNSVPFQDVYTITVQLQLFAAIAYNFYFTIEFGLILKSIYSKSTIQGASLKKAKIIAIKSIIHCVTSSVANVVYVYVPVLGDALYNVLIIAGIHFLFNYKLERNNQYMINLYQSFRGTKESLVVRNIKSSFMGGTNSKSTKIHMTDSLVIRDQKSPPHSVFQSLRGSFTNIRGSFTLKDVVIPKNSKVYMIDTIQNTDQTSPQTDTVQKPDESPPQLSTVGGVHFGTESTMDHRTPI